MNTVTTTAPTRIWLQVSDDRSDADLEFPDPTEDLTWCQDSVLACEVEYVRADLVRAAMPENWENDPDTKALAEALGMAHNAKVREGEL